MSSEAVVLTGTGRCGTGWAAAVLRAHGLPATHEQAFTPFAAPPARLAPGSIESSWMALPAIPLLRPRPRVVLLWRDPVQTVRSFLGIGFFDPPAPDPGSTHYHYQRFVAEHSDAFSAASRPADRTYRWWTGWNRRALSLDPPPDAVVRIPPSAADWESLSAVLPAPVPADALAATAARLPESARNARHRSPGRVPPPPPDAAEVLSMLSAARMA